MDMDEQIVALRNRYLSEMKRVYNWERQMKLMSVLFFNKIQYEKKMKAIEAVSSIIEGAVKDCNPKRVLRYVVVLHNIIDTLDSSVKKDYDRFWNNKLTH